MSTADPAATDPAPSAVTVPTSDGSMPAHLWTPAVGSGAGIVVFQEIFGVTDYIRSRCADLAALGYTVLAPEIYWRLEDTDVDESHPDFLQHAMAIVGRLDWDLAVSDGQAALAHLRGLPGIERAGLLGFCFGGGLAWSVAAKDDADALVSYYGSAIPQLLHLAPAVRTPSLHHFGLADTFIDQETVARIREAIAAPTTRFETYADAGHAFDNPHPVFFHAAASAEAWQTTTTFLAEHLSDD
jgi:carboxymethylenebutenolidase